MTASGFASHGQGTASGFASHGQGTASGFASHGQGTSPSLASPASTPPGRRLVNATTCAWETTTGGILDACGKPVVAAQIDPDGDGDAYGVCAAHVRKDRAVPLTALLNQAWTVGFKTGSDFGMSIGETAIGIRKHWPPVPDSPYSQANAHTNR